MNLLRLAARNIVGSLFRSSMVFLGAALVAAFVVASTLVVRGAQDNLRLAIQRLGADVIVLPWGTITNPMQGARLMSIETYDWLPLSHLKRIAGVRGVAAVTPQLYLTTLADSPYCDGCALRLVAFEPETDFVLAPWLPQGTAGALGVGEAIAGSRVTLPPGEDSITLHGYRLRVVRALLPTDSDLDEALFLTFGTAHELARASTTPTGAALELTPASMSVALVKALPGADPHELSVELLDRVPGIIPIESTDLFQTQRQHMLGLLRSVIILLVIAWLLAVGFIGLVFSIAVNERRRQIGVLRALGSTTAVIVKSLLAEGAILALAGGVTGAALGVALVSVFQQAIMDTVGVAFSVPAPAALALLALGALALALLSVSVAAAVPAYRITRLEPALVMKE